MRTSIVILLTLSTTPAFAQAQQVHGLAIAAADDEIVITALRTPMQASQVASSMTVLDQAEIERAQTPAMSDLLARMPGISVTRNGGYGTATTIRIRGAESDQTVLVIDGIKLADPSSTGGGYNFANLLTGDAARIEILRGPQSILWGSQAIGGVVNIVTAASTRPLEGSIDIEAGSRQTVIAHMAVGGASGPVTWRVAGNSFSTDGISAISPRFGGNERDGYRNVGVGGNLGIRIMDGVSADLRGVYSSRRTDIDSAGTIPDSPEFSRNAEWLGYAGLNVAPFGDAWRNRLSYSYSQTDRDNINPARKVRQTSFDARGRTRRFEYQGNLELHPGWDATFGAEREEQVMRSASPSDSLAPVTTIRASADIDSLYAQLNGTIVPGLTLSGGLRYDHHSTFNGNTVLGAGAAWALFDGRTIVRASYGEGFKAPTLYQLFSEYGNSVLAPEKAHGVDAGVEQHLFGERLIVSATWFDRTTTNLITYNGCPATNRPALCFQPGTTIARGGYYANVRRSAAHGVELAGATRIGGLSLSGNYSLTAAEDRSPGLNFGNQLARQPRHAANGSATYAWASGLVTGVAVRWSGKTIDTARTSATTTPFVNPAYTLVDLRAEWPLGEGVTVFGRVENLFDEYYETARRYGTLGRSIHAGFRGRF